MRAAAAAVEASQQAMQKFPAAAFHHGSQSLAQSLGTNRPLKKPQQQRSQVKPCSPREDGELGAAAQVSQDFQRLAAVVSRGENVGRFQAIQQMVRNAPPLRQRQFPRTHVEAAIQLHGIVVHHLAVQPLRQHQGQLRLAGGGGAHDRNQGIVIRARFRQRWARRSFEQSRLPRERPRVLRTPRASPGEHRSPRP